MKCSKEHAEIEFADIHDCPACDYAGELDNRNAEAADLRRQCSALSQELGLRRTDIATLKHALARAAVFSSGCLESISALVEAHGAGTLDG